MIFFPPVTPELEAGVVEKEPKVEGPRRGDATKTLPAPAEFGVSGFRNTEKHRLIFLPSQLRIVRFCTKNTRRSSSDRARKQSVPITVPQGSPLATRNGPSPSPGTASQIVACTFYGSVTFMAHLFGAKLPPAIRVQPFPGRSSGMGSKGQAGPIRRFARLPGAAGGDTSVGAPSH
jgi:hypothetical protein